MKRSLRRLVIVMTMAVLLTACAGSSGEEDIQARTTQEGQQTPIATQVADSRIQGEAVSLLRQNMKAQASLDTVRGRMDSEMKMGGTTTTMKADFAIDLPERMYMHSKVGSLDLEAVVTDGRTFMKLGDRGWMEAPEGMTEFDIESVWGMASTSEPDLALFENLKVEEGEVIDGVQTVHVSFEVDVEKAMQQASDILGAEFSDVLEEIEDSPALSGKMQMDMWIGKDDGLTRRVESRAVGRDNYEMKSTVEFYGHGKPVEIPSLEEMLEKTGG